MGQKDLTNLFNYQRTGFEIVAQVAPAEILNITSSPLARTDYEVLNINWHPQSSFYLTIGNPSPGECIESIIH